MNIHLKQTKTFKNKAKSYRIDRNWRILTEVWKYWSTSDHNTLEEDISTLEESKAAYNYLDITILPTDIESVTKSLGSKKAPGPDKIRNEMMKAGIQYLKTALCKLFNLILKIVFFP